jgi:hypothetical protein
MGPPVVDDSSPEDDPSGAPELLLLEDASGITQALVHGLGA